MKTSVLIIAHNEEKYISKCIESILNQTEKPDEIILIVHNSTDNTKVIAENYPIKVVSFNGEVGPVYARLEGFKYLNGDIIFCIDGDAYANKNWIKEMKRTLMKDNILVGSYIKIIGSFFVEVSNIWNRYFCVSKGPMAIRWIWGASMAFWRKDKYKIERYFKEIIDIAKKINLPKTKIAEDFYLAHEISKEGNIEVINKTFVTAYEKEKNSWKSILRNRENFKNGNILIKYLENKIK